jgi:hypothetical protein
VVVSADDDWSAAAAFDRGSFATFLGFTTVDPDRIYGYAVGDSVLFIVDEEGCVRWLPHLLPEDFGKDPPLLSTHAGSPLEHKVELKSHRIEFPRSLKYPDRLKIIAATDAMAAWAVGDGDKKGVLSRLNMLVELRSNREFGDFVQSARATRTIKVDDCTLMVVEA